MSPEHLADSQIHLCIKLDSGDPSWSNIETGLSENELLDMLVQKLPCCDVSSAVDKVYHHLVDHLSP
jgi:hypothetical protein